MIAPLALLLALSAAPGPTCAPASTAAPVCAPAPDPELRERITVLLGILDRAVPAEAWRALPPEALPLLERLAGEAGGRASDRARALEGAAALGSDGAVHRRLAADGATPYAVRAAAIRGLGRLVPPARLGAELSALRDRDPDARIRAAAAAVLKQAGTK